ncbi:DUF2268 domain-containing protein [Paenibacillus sp. WLX2291]|uniref:DUF2268 domain-containing protein n=1 Tax=Paenibacillus sp. WLX2291 TaxID=3296934 RepID=UPI00398412CD
MNITPLRSDRIYQHIMQAPLEYKIELYRQQMLRPFMPKWQIQHIPFQSSDPNGFDVIQMSNITNISPIHITPTIHDQLAAISTDDFWQACQQAVQSSLNVFIQQGISLPVSDYLYTIWLGDKNSPLMQINNHLCGDGGIPGYIIVNLVPNADTLSRIPAVLAHECNHNVRYQFIQWDQHVTLGEMIVSEGLAENFAESLYGMNMLGPWVTRTSAKVLNTTVKPLIQPYLQLTGFQQFSPYLYGDEITRMQQGTPVGMPYAGGYACGYHLVHYYLRRTGISIAEATTLPASEILAEVGEFWHETTIVHGS